jgi:hypothetical protein
METLHDLDQGDLEEVFHNLGVQTEFLPLNLDLRRGFQLRIDGYNKWVVARSSYTKVWVAFCFKRTDPWWCRLGRTLARRPPPSNFERLTQRERDADIVIAKPVLHTLKVVELLVGSICPGVDKDDYEASVVRDEWEHRAD